MKAILMDCEEWDEGNRMMAWRLLGPATQRWGGFKMEVLSNLSAEGTVELTS